MCATLENGGNLLQVQRSGLVRNFLLAERFRNGDPDPHGGTPILVAGLNHQNGNVTTPLRGVAIFGLLALFI